jgi:DNA-directed RNA polymerase specialized sigma subunit
MTTPEQLRDLQTKAREAKEQKIRTIPARDMEMIRLRYVEGLTLQAIATRYNLTRQRVMQVVNKPL